MNPTKLQKALDEIMENGLQKVHMPYVKGKGKSVRIKNTIFRESKKDGGYLLFDVGTHKRVGTTFSKRGAIAYAKARARSDKQTLSTVLHLDSKLNKHYMDSIFHKNTIEQTQDETRKEMAYMRFELAKDHTYDYICQLDEYIFDD
jgi:hypothetical protein|tara:strand:- start:578 stop:1015 length:438 start_codon:yes stop_codon:yes gene_type:complete